ncbi:MAG: type II toxin-antitoxin system VapC family toxin [Acidimicrobiia bacterium]
MGLTVLDAGVLIGFLDRRDTHHPAARATLRAARDRGDRLVLPASAFAEILVGPSRQVPAAVDAVDQLITRLPVDVEPLDREIAARAALLRARHRALKLPDALVIATAVHLDADTLVTTDRRWPSRSRLGIRPALERI